MADHVRLENSRLIVEVNRFGAELSRIYDYQNEREVLWDADPALWKRHAPVLFPMVGQCFGGKYRVNGWEYPMGQHGFARDLDFELVSADQQEVWYRLTDTEETKIRYPFSFCLEIGHRLEENRITVMWRVQNPSSSQKLLFTIGGHPAFAVPKEISGDLWLSFPGQTKLAFEPLSEAGFVPENQEKELILDNGFTVIDDHFYDIPTYIFHQAQVEQITLALPDKTPYVSLHTAGFPYVGVWSPDPKRFHCLEPWMGRCDNEGFEGPIEEKKGILTLQPEGEFEASYTIEIH